MNWLERFPEYKDRESYISGESYAGTFLLEAMEGFQPCCTFGQTVNFGLLLRNVDGVLERTQNRKSGAKHVALYASVTTFQMEGNNSDFCQPSIFAWISQYARYA